MADYIYTLEIRLTPDQLKGVTLVQDISREAGMNIYLTGGAVRDMISGFTIRDLDFTLQGNPLKLQKDLERAGAAVSSADEDLKTLYLVLPGNVRAEISAARTERYDKVGKPPIISPATIIEDLRRRDFTINAMALSLNPGSRGLLMDPFNGAADIEAKVIRILHNYAFVEDPSRLIRATRFAARFHWPLEERTQSRYQSAKENNYIEHISDRAIGQEIEQIAYEEDPLHILRSLEKEDWLKVLNPRWSSAKVDAAGLGQLLKTRQQMNELGYWPDPAPAVMYFLTSRLGDKDIADMRRLIPRKDLVAAWKDLEDNAKDLAKRLTGKEAATPSRTWKLLSEARPEMILFLAVTARQQAVAQKIKNFFTKWRQVQQKIPLPEMTELHITPQLPAYPKIAHDVFMLLLDGKLRSRTETLKFLKPLAPPPPPPPPPPPKRGRAAKAAAAAAAQVAAAGKRKGKTPTPPAAVQQTAPPKALAAVASKNPPIPAKHITKQSAPKKAPKKAGKKPKSQKKR
ncbi:MAG TPA: CCA tRNA nucleotidyltransferase [Terriglobales bacterium]|nr:CCA tRNA nucleotidyltransferase [Terriglobales bacterium]